MKSSRNASTAVIDSQVSDARKGAAAMFSFLSYIRCLIMGPIFLVVTAVLSTVTILLALMKSRFVNPVMKFWGRISCWMFGVKLAVSGTENIPENRGVMYVFNHTSHFDILAIFGSLPKTPRFGAKIELFKIPIFSQAMRAVGTLPIPRANRAEAFKVYKDAEARARKGESFILAPEGTRQFTEEIGKFKTGPFIFAINAHMPLVPVVIHGAGSVLPKKRILPNWGRWSSRIDIQILPPTFTDDFNLDNRPQLQEKVRQQMVDAFAHMKKSHLS